MLCAGDAKKLQNHSQAKLYPRVMGFDALKHYFITYEVYI